jgi:hypothetical protein
MVGALIDSATREVTVADIGKINDAFVPDVDVEQSKSGNVARLNSLMFFQTSTRYEEVGELKP